ncbi:hypothetical protein FOZ63_021706, partial [Perkinsus olseni]
PKSYKGERRISKLRGQLLPLLSRTTLVHAFSYADLRASSVDFTVLLSLFVYLSSKSFVLCIMSFVSSKFPPPSNRLLVASTLSVSSKTILLGFLDCMIESDHPLNSVAKSASTVLQSLSVAELPKDHPTARTRRGDDSANSVRRLGNVTATQNAEFHLNWQSLSVAKGDS